MRGVIQREPTGVGSVVKPRKGCAIHVDLGPFFVGYRKFSVYVVVCHFPLPALTVQLLQESCDFCVESQSM